MPFTEIQEEIQAPEAYLMTLTRRFMMRITNRIREVRNGLVIINGESLGQVASQTLESMQAISCDQHSIIRPVVTMDKLKSLTSRRKSIPLKFLSSRLRTAALFLHLIVLRPILRLRMRSSMKNAWMLKVWLSEQ